MLPLDQLGRGVVTHLAQFEPLDDPEHSERFLVLVLVLA